MNTKRFYLIYQVTNNINGKIYIGKHETNKLDDNYMGSGKILKRAQQKYGLENFTFRVLMYLHNREELCLLEQMVVTKEFCERTDTYNVKIGGEGGWQYVNSNSEIKSRANRTKWSNLTQQQRKQIGRHATAARSGEYAHTQEFSAKVSEGLKRLYREHPEKHPSLHRTLTQEQKERISRIMKTDKNWMFGKVWIHNEEQNLSIPVKKEAVQQFLSDGWKIGKIKKRQIDETRHSHFRCWINNGTESKFVLKSEQEQFLSEGWKPGRLSFTS